MFDARNAVEAVETAPVAGGTAGAALAATCLSKAFALTQLLSSPGPQREVLRELKRESEATSAAPRVAEAPAVAFFDATELGSLAATSFLADSTGFVITG